MSMTLLIWLVVGAFILAIITEEIRLYRIRKECRATIKMIDDFLNSPDRLRNKEKSNQPKE